MKKYTRKEVIKITGLTNHTLTDLMRKKRGKGPPFIPQWPGEGQGNRHYFSEEDIKKLKEFKKFLYHMRNYRELYFQNKISICGKD